MVKEKQNKIYDLWGSNNNTNRNINKPNLKYPKVPIPHPGQSYNPNKKDLNKLLTTVVENNKYLIKNEEESSENSDDDKAKKIMRRKKRTKKAKKMIMKKRKKMKIFKKKISMKLI